MPVVTSLDSPLELLRTTLAGGSGLPPLGPSSYALAHRAYEAHSDQRARISAWLGDAVADRLPGPGSRSVLSIGTGDGSVDGPLAAGLAAGRGRLRWVAAEPDARVGAECRRRLRQALGSGGDVVLHAGTFDTLGDTVGRETFDLVLAVHSLYYVPDLPAAVAAVGSRLAHGGSAVLLMAPLEELCLLTAAVDPTSHSWWSGDLADALAGAGLAGTTTRLEGRLDVTDCFDPASETGRQVLAFLVGADCASLRAADRAVLLEALAAISDVTDGRRTVSHPVDAHVAR